MARISTYLQVSLDGYFAGPDGEIDAFKNNPDPEFEEFSLERARGNSTLLFGRTTYEMMSRTGQHAFERIDPTELRLVESHSFKNGLVWLLYQPS